jgi:CubicO group peptidase (beta-lactamase class C family)
MWLGTIKFDLETLHDVRSVTKSIISLLFGIAMADHAIVSLDSPVLDYFPEYKDLQTSERRKIRLRDLLPMTSGLHGNEWSNLYGDIRNSETAMDLAADRCRDGAFHQSFHRRVCRKEVVRPPGHYKVCLA